ncbi:hypothetical protein [Dyadobacter psychrotolerans]|uniref:Lipoprotein n=1 Tax=Dyadobacter psychrotolerans TaxID=2541721 RepID=A0A4R5DPW7_9BACT|nr:hypothetical protein [Dyadobacter psychrotolerans]TDE16299.1 hypothetical protein E0F88_08610 [Dyadobacter psychrotolerans]
MKSMMNVFSVLLFFSCLGLISCIDKSKVTPTDDTAYFPLKAGFSSEFDLQRTIYSRSDLPEIRNYTIRQLIADSFKDLQNHWVYKIEYAAGTGQENWKTDSIIPIWRTTDNLLVQENGQTVLRQVYPISEGASWNGNCYNSLGEVKFRFTRVGLPFQSGSQLFPKTITVIRQDDSTLLSRNRYIEIYAEHVGLIRTEKSVLQYCSTPDCRGKGMISSGWKEISVIKNFGKI